MLLFAQLSLFSDVRILRVQMRKSSLIISYGPLKSENPLHLERISKFKDHQFKLPETPTNIINFLLFCSCWKVLLSKEDFPQLMGPIIKLRLEHS